jgi:hypothetical protein
LKLPFIQSSDSEINSAEGCSFEISFPAVADIDDSLLPFISNSNPAPLFRGLPVRNHQYPPLPEMKSRFLTDAAHFRIVEVTIHPVLRFGNQFSGGLFIRDLDSAIHGRAYYRSSQTPT